MRTYIARHLVDALMQESTASISSLPIAPTHLQKFWCEAQTIIGIPSSQQTPLHLLPIDSQDINAAPGVGSINVCFAEQLSHMQSTIRNRLLHCAAVVQQVNLGTVQKNMIGWLLINMTNQEVGRLYANVVKHQHDRHALASLYTACLDAKGAEAQHVFDQEANRVKEAAQKVMIEKTTCQDCLLDMMGTNIFDQLSGEVTPEYSLVEQRLRELAGKHCAYHHA